MISKKYIVFILAIVSVAVTLPWAPKSFLIKDVNASVLPMQEMESSIRVNAMNKKILMSSLSLGTNYDRDYKIGPDELIETSVFEEEKLNKTVRVSSRGNIRLPVMLPHYTEAQLAPAPEIPKVISKKEVQKFMVEYRDRFMKLELDPFMDLFSKEAIENRMLPYADIREAFRKTIVRSKSIIYKLKIYSIHTYRDGAAVTGHYEIFQSFRKLGKRHLEGDIQWDLVLENGSLKIREVNYGRKH